MYSISLEKAVTENSILSIRIIEHITMARRLSWISSLLLLITIHSKRKFNAIILHSSKNPCLAYWATVNPSGKVRVNAPNIYEPCMKKNTRYIAQNPANIKVHTFTGTFFSSLVFCKIKSFFFLRTEVSSLPVPIIRP